MYEIVVFLLLVIIANILSAVFGAYYEEVFYLKRKEILYKKMHTELFQKAKQIELACYDNPEFYNDFIWSVNQSDEKALAVLNSAGGFLHQMTQIASVFGIMLSIHWGGVVIAVLSAALSFFLKIRMNRQEYALSQEQNPLQRKRDYTSRVLYMSDYAKEIRLSNVKQKLIQNFTETNETLVERIRFFGKKTARLSLLDRIGANYILIYGYVLYLTYLVLVKKALSYGDFIGLYNGVRNLSDNILDFGDSMSQFQKHSLYIEKFRVFLNYSPQMSDGELPVPKGDAELVLTLKNVSFQYENAKQPTLQNINLVIHPREKLALVGYNGAGKTTLVKLLMRLYDPTEGTIELNGVDIRRYALAEYRNYFGVVFQDFKLFAATIAENVIMDRMSKEAEAEVLRALEKSDFSGRLVSMEDGIDTDLTREFSKKGVHLSGGEAQKVAIARIFTKNRQMLILDEPSSALDPVTEYYINQNMLREAGDKAVIYISHRLSTTKMADRIVMLEKGRIIENGSHQELMELGGKYAQMFAMQAEKYQ